MKAIIAGLFLLFIFCNQKFSNSNGLKPNQLSKSDTTFEFHFAILDSAVRSRPKDTLYSCCQSSIYFMEEKTGIEASSAGTLVGKFYFTKSDLKKWHRWHQAIVR